MPEQNGHSGRDSGVMIIAVAKLCKAVMLVAAGVLALCLADHNPPELLRHWANAVGVDPNNTHLDSLAQKLAGTTDGKLKGFGIGSFLYALLFSVEGIGLLLQKRWAEYLTIVITTSFIPLEITELVKHGGWGKIVIILLNVAAVVYLIARVRREKAHRHDANAQPA